MREILKQSIKQAIRENFIAYPESYPLNDSDVSEDAADQVINYAKNEFENTELETSEKGTEAEWIDECIDAYIDYFELDYQSVKDYFEYILK